MAGDSGDGQADAAGEATAAIPDATVNHGSCSGLAASGVWEDITPPSVKAQLPGPSNCQYGVQALAVDPVNTGVVYLGTCSMGVWKTTDCGATWSHVNTGTNAQAIDSGMHWSMAIDPVEPNVLYTNTGYGSVSNGAWKSTNGGADWEALWPPSDGTLAQVVQYDFVHKIRIDPYDHRHLLISFHATCAAPYSAACLAESHDAGSTWNIVNGDPSWVGSEDQTVWFLNDGSTWAYASQSNGMWLTMDHASTWRLVNASWGGHNGGQMYRTPAGAFYLAAPPGILRSVDGQSWTLDPNAGSLMIGMTGDGTTLYASRGPYAQTPAYQPYLTSSENDGTHWAQMPSPALSNGGYELGYDGDHHVLYSSNFTAGFWRVVTP
jgi:hypothetical protein